MLAAAVRCRSCGTTFATSRPQTTNEFQNRTQQDERQPALRRNSVLLFAFCVLPFTAFIASVAGVIWYSIRKNEIQRLPALYSGICKAGLIVGLGQSLFAAMVILWLIGTS